MSSSSSKSVVITGSSGLLGRALLRIFKEDGKWKSVTGTAFSRWCT